MKYGYNGSLTLEARCENCHQALYLQLEAIQVNEEMAMLKVRQGIDLVCACGEVNSANFTGMVSFSRENPAFILMPVEVADDAVKDGPYR